jgi:hypothetical protein
MKRLDEAHVAPLFSDLKAANQEILNLRRILIKERDILANRVIKNELNGRAVKGQLARLKKSALKVFDTGFTRRYGKWYSPNNKMKLTDEQYLNLLQMLIELL